MATSKTAQDESDLLSPSLQRQINSKRISEKQRTLNMIVLNIKDQRTNELSYLEFG